MQAVVVGDDAGFVEKYRTLLSGMGFDVQVQPDIEATARYIRNTDPHVILMPDTKISEQGLSPESELEAVLAGEWESIDALRVITTAIIVCVGPESEDHLRIALLDGADIYIRTDTDDAEFAPRVSASLRRLN